jgi:hypothetical protein
MRVGGWRVMVVGVLASQAALAGKVDIRCDKAWSIKLDEAADPGRKINIYDREQPGRGHTPKASRNHRTGIFLFPGHWYALEPQGFQAGATVAFRLLDDAGKSYVLVSGTVDDRDSSRFVRFTPVTFFYDRDYRGDWKSLPFNETTKGAFYEVFEEGDLASGTLTLKRNYFAVPQ